MNEYLSLADIEALARDVLIRAGTTAANAAIVARSIRQAERDGLREGGLAALPDAVEHLRCGRVNGRAEPRLTRIGAAALSVDADGGFACPTVAAGLDDLAQAARDNGIAILSIHGAYPMAHPAHFAEACALAGLAGICFATVRVAGPAGGDIAAPRQLALALPDGNRPPAIVEERAAAGSGLAALVQVLAGPDAAALARPAPEFEGPLGGPFRCGHGLLALRPDLLRGMAAPDLATETLQTTRNRREAQGVEVPAALLQRIITA